MANQRTQERLQVIDNQFGQEAMFGMAGWWTISAYWRLEEAYKMHNHMPPEILPRNVEENLADESQPAEKRRAFVTAQQFMAAIIRDDVEMASAIFGAAYTSSTEDYTALMYTVLLLSVKMSNTADNLKRQA